MYIHIYIYIYIIYIYICIYIYYFLLLEGRGSDDFVPTPRLLERFFSPAAADQIVSIACCDFVTLALSRSGAVYRCSINSFDNSYSIKSSNDSYSINSSNNNYSINSSNNSL